MPILQRKDRHDAWWVDLRANGRRIRRKSPIQSAEGALEYERELRATFRRGDDDTVPLYGGSTFALFAERWMDDYVAVANRPSTRQEKRYALTARLLPAFGHLPLAEITTGTIDSAVANWMRAGLTVKRINNLLTILRRALRCAEEWHLIDRAPFVRHHRYFPPIPQYLTQTESTRLVTSMPRGFWRTFVHFLLSTGVRFGEAAALRWEDLVLDTDRPIVSIKRAVSDGIVAATKTLASRRTIALIPEIASELRLHKARCAESEWVFTSPTGAFYRPERTSYILKRACRAATVPVITWHKLRHSCATQLLTNGVPITVVKEVLGHTSIEVTSIYTHVAAELMWDYMGALSPTGARPIRSGFRENAGDLARSSAA